MRKLVPLVLALVLLLVATSVVSADSPVVHRVSVGGPDVCEGLGLEPGCDANFSLIALEFADGSVKGQWTDRFANGGGFHAVVECLSVSGNEAWVGGVVTQGEGLGLAVVTRVADNGTSAGEPSDQISFSFLAPSADVCAEQLPLPLLDAPQGQVIVE